MTPHNHLKGHGFSKCGGTYSPTAEEMVIRYQVIHGTAKVGYGDSSYINGRTKSKFKCLVKPHHEYFEMTPENHLQGHGCPKCSKAQYSQEAIKWLNTCAELQGIFIRHAENHPKGEYRISSRVPVDGYCPETNTVYEFWGSWWHGHPHFWPPDKVHPISGKTYGELYRKTLQKMETIQAMGYNLVDIWEHTWLAYKKENSVK